MRERSSVQLEGVGNFAMAAIMAPLMRYPGLEVEKRAWEKNSSGQHSGSCMQV